MDIYDFINSKDIQKHCRDMQHKFDPLECAFLVWQNRECNLSEKHQAYVEIAKKYPDYMFYLREWDYKKVSLYFFLTEFVRIENNLINKFEENTGNVYKYVMEDEREGCSDKVERLYSAKSICLSALKKYELKSKWNKFDIVCIPTISNISEKESFISSYINDSLESVFITEKGVLAKEECNVFHTFDNMTIEVTLPFEDNDILVDKYSYLAIPFDFNIREYRFFDNGMSLCHCRYPLEEIYVSNYLNLEYAPKAYITERDPNDEDAPF